MLLRSFVEYGNIAFFMLSQEHSSGERLWFSEMIHRNGWWAYQKNFMVSFPLQKSEHKHNKHNELLVLFLKRSTTQFISSSIQNTEFKPNNKRLLEKPKADTVLK